MWSSIEGIFPEVLQRREPKYRKSSINLFKLLLKESDWKTICIGNSMSCDIWHKYHE